MLHPHKLSLLVLMVLSLSANACSNDCTPLEGDFHGFIATVTRTDGLGLVCDPGVVTYIGGDVATERVAEVIGCEYYGPLNEYGPFEITAYKPNYKQQTSLEQEELWYGDRDCELYLPRPHFKLEPVL